MHAKDSRKGLYTTYEGTARADIRRVLKKHGLRYRIIKSGTLKDLKAAIDDGSPVLISTHGQWHYSVVYGYSVRHIWTMNPSLGSMGALRCAVSKKQIKETWDRWGLIVSRPE